MKRIFKLLILLSMIGIVSLFIYKMNTNPKEFLRNVSASELSNTKIGWGIKRNNNHIQPDVGSKNKEILDKYEGIYMGNKESKKIYITFDLGYEAGYTPKILEVLKNNNVKATFFITAHYLNTKPELVERMIKEGHIVGNHTVNHKSMPTCSLDVIKKEVMDLHNAVYNKFNYEMEYIRPPKGEYSQRTIAYTNTLGYKSVMWSFAYDDWIEEKQGREEYGKKKIFDNLHNGEVMLLHATSKDNANILDEVIKRIKKEGYEIKNINEFEK